MIVQSSAMTDVQKWPTMKEIVDPEGSFARKWNVIFIVSCVLSVLADPLFLYIPIINKDMKCLRMDRNLNIAALAFRSLTDLCYMLSIFFQVCRYNSCSALGFGICSSISSLRNILLNITKIIWDSYIIIDILAVLPLPQVAVLSLLSRTRGSASLGALMNFLVLVQYVPRVCRIYLSCKESSRISREKTPIWIKGVLNLFLYILASHVLGAFWYFFAVQRITTCWQNACRKEYGCEPSNFDCHDYHTLRNVTFLNDSCPIDPANAKLFDFGMFLDVLQFGVLGSTNYSEKFAKCFWWGLQNLSSLGSNLPLSIHTWENMFAAFVSVIGLLLFLYLIGNLQTYMQLDVARLENQRWKMKIKKKMDLIEGDIEKRLGLPSKVMSYIMAKVEVQLKENRDVEVENIMSTLPLDLQELVKISMLRKVPLIQNMDEEVLNEISKYLRAKTYKEDDIIIPDYTKLEMMIFITDGLVSIPEGFKKDNITIYRSFQRGAGQFFGEQVLWWPARHSSDMVSLRDVRAIGDVDAVVLLASDIQHVHGKFISEFDKEMKWDISETDKVAMLRKVPKLETMEYEVLKAISTHLKPERCNPYDTELICDGAPLCRMIFVTGGSVEVYGSVKNRGNAGDFYGEELLDWVLDKSFPALSPVSTVTVRTMYDFEVCYDYVDVLVLTADDLAKVVSGYKSHFSRVITHPTVDLVAFVTLHWLRKAPMLGYMDEKVLKEISKHMKLMSSGSGTSIIKPYKPLEIMFVILGGELVNDGFGDRLERVYGVELVHWITTWASHKNFPATLPLSDSYVKVFNANVEVAAIGVDDLKRIVYEFRLDFMKQTTLPTDSEGKLAMLDPLTMLKKVPKLENMGEQVLKAICSLLKPMKYSDDTSDDTSNGRFLFPREKIDKMFFIIEGLVTYRVGHEPRSFFYPGNYIGEQLLEWVLDPFVNLVATMNGYATFMPVGEVQVLVLTAKDLAKVVSQFETHFVKQVPQDFLNDSDRSIDDYPIPTQWRI